ncbi:PhaM family polyhydroxyalkanoate granule multifunctional regulatory protein [Hydrogenophaga sp.]|uniref:PhaM family polyhydroxyalkanoate granule multifunctional regulatory protein n=1 Tax=Hydrogenophaga sp. TaxID=1904254 RepID=UPI002722D0CC|nr:PhaM family polyhydroxyalkanoate granule multifunctional regulatory protein [Hydrogenophaga sp.]MDO9439108.1 hypothetical protein [Hydrogenophaga sp.]
MSDAPSSGFGKFVPGFEFLQNLAGQAAGGVAQGISQNIPQLPNLGSWVAPTFNVEDLEKRITELKAVHFWLDQNAKALGATIQALEVQKMTLSTLKTMNFSMGDVANALKIKAADTFAGFTGAAAPSPASAPPAPFAGLEIPARTYGNATPEPDPEEEPEEEPEPAPEPKRSSRKVEHAVDAPAPAGGVVDPMQWWGALSQQFQQIASNAMKDVAKQTTLDATRQVATGLTDRAVKTATGMAGKAARNLTDTVARNVGAAAGVGRAAVRAVSERPPSKKKAPARARPAPVAKAKPKAKPKAQPKAAVGTPNMPLMPGDWAMPGGFFPGLTPSALATPRKQTPAQPATKKAAARKAPATQKSAARKTTRR